MRPLIAALLCLLAAFAEATIDPREYQIGLQLYTVRDDCAKDLPGTLQAVAAMGYSGVELAGTYGRSAQDLKALLSQSHLKCYGSHINMDDLLGDNFIKTVAFNQELGNHYLIVPALSDDRRNSHDALLKTAALFNDYARRLAAFEITLAFHDEADMFRPIAGGEIPWLTLMSNTDKRVAIEFDTGNALEGGAQAAPYVAKFPGRVLSVHLKDYSATKPMVLLGEGDEDWKDLLPLLKGKAGTKWFIIEQETYPFPPLECARKCLENFKRMMGDKG